MAGALAALAVWGLLTVLDADLGREGRIVLAMAVLMAVWWITEAIPIAVTALVPLLVLPLTDVQEFGAVSASYGHKIIFLALSGFLLATALQRWGVHRRIAALVLSRFGGSPGRLVAGFMAASFVLSMWISNTATAILMLPVALSLLGADEDHNLAPALLLGICYACSVGGMSTLVGTTTNLFFAGYAESSLARPIGFAEWTGFALPLAVGLGIAIWLVLTRWLFPVRALSGAVASEALGAWSKPERRVALVFAATALAWMVLPLTTPITMYQVGMIALFALFLLPSGTGEQLLDWPAARAGVPWGVLLLIGGGLALAKAFGTFGVSTFVAGIVTGAAGLPGWAALLLMVALMVFLTEMTSNVASVTALTPVFASIALPFGLSPMVVVAAITLAASCAFMLPVATPPNAVIYGSERVEMRQMVRAGLVLNGLAIGLVSLWVGLAGPVYFG